MNNCMRCQISSDCQVQRKLFDCCRKHPYKLLALLGFVLFLIYFVDCIAHASRETYVINFLSHMAVTKPKTCDPESNFILEDQPSEPPVYPHLPKTNDKEYPVPNIVHYIWFVEKPTEFKYMYMLSILSVHKFMKPEAIYFICNSDPVGPYWDQVKDLPELKIEYKKPTSCLFNRPIKNPIYGPSSSNPDRLIALLKHGGIYLDLDVLIVQSFDPLRKYPCTLGKESPEKINSGIVICSKDSPFLKIWLEHYLVDYKVWQWGYNSGWVPTRISQQWPSLIHLEPDRLVQPNGNHIEQIWGNEQFDWWNNYAIHTLFRTWKIHKHFVGVVEPDENFIQKDNSTFSQLARKIISS